MTHPDLLTDEDLATRHKPQPPGKYVNMWLITRNCCCMLCEKPFHVGTIIPDCCIPPYDSIELAEIGAEKSMQAGLAEGGPFSQYEGPERLP